MNGTQNLPPPTRLPPRPPDVGIPRYAAPATAAAPSTTDEISIRLTDRIGEIDDALALVHDGFVSSGFMTPEPSGRRVLPHYLTPGTCFAVARDAEGVVATCATIPEGPYGLPSEGVFAEEFAEARKMGRLVEVSSLSVADGPGRSTRRVILMLLVAQIRFVHQRNPGDVPICSVHPTQERFYRSTFGFTRVGEERDLYGAPAVVLASPAWRSVESLTLSPGVARGMAARLFADPDPAWLIDEMSMGAGPRLPDVRDGAW